jgi:hypothetical protein
MQTFVAAVMTVLGTLLVLGGVAVIVVRATAPAGEYPVEDLPPSVEVGATTHARAAHWADRVTRLMRRMYPSDRLIAWGIVLLLLAAAAAGMIGVNVQVSTTGH